MVELKKMGVTMYMHSSKVLLLSFRMQLVLVEYILEVQIVGLTKIFLLGGMEP